ncbi:hypothetical protein ILUMI_12549 [Ignelater luminosus]|uniref:PiggyBac transposable element-derived protein domain-containing protein n=1 Tax=Ignelater luminosus TaxID=2038154 RepID=A0A8K0GBP4_IGNLU|nr:hypothetical protein ILUMI_12549 [Ignelater luminosus]
MKANTKREPQSSLFAFAEYGKVTMCSYVPKKNKSVILLSTMHSDNSVSGAKNKPEIMQYDNSTKRGVDNMDKMVTHYSTKRRTCRWPFAMFYNMTDTAYLASYIIYTCNNLLAKKSSHSRRTFYRELGKSLAMPSIEHHQHQPVPFIHRVLKDVSQSSVHAIFVNHTINNKAKQESLAVFVIGLYVKNTRNQSLNVVLVTYDKMFQ